MTKPLELGQKPQQGLGADTPGSYAPAVRLVRTRLDRGEDIVGEVFITGYGRIDSAKLVFYPSLGLIDQNLSTIRFGYEQVGDLVYFGGQEEKVDERGITLSLVGGMVRAGWARPSLFFDMAQGVLPIIATEMTQKRAPVSFQLRIRTDARPGQYEFRFVLTYFNGLEWQTASETTNVVVRNLIQRYELQAAILASIAAVVGSIAAVVTIAPPIIWLIRMWCS
jgi:hypothetical protein